MFLFISNLHSEGLIWAVNYRCIFLSGSLTLLWLEFRFVFDICNCWLKVVSFEMQQKCCWWWRLDLIMMLTSSLISFDDTCTLEKVHHFFSTTKNSSGLLKVDSFSWKSNQIHCIFPWNENDECIILLCAYTVKWVVVDSWNNLF